MALATPWQESAGRPPLQGRTAHDQLHFEAVQRQLDEDVAIKIWLFRWVVLRLKCEGPKVEFWESAAEHFSRRDQEFLFDQNCL